MSRPKPPPARVWLVVDHDGKPVSTHRKRESIELAPDHRVCGPYVLARGEAEEA